MLQQYLLIEQPRNVNSIEKASQPGLAENASYYTVKDVGEDGDGPVENFWVSRAVVRGKREHVLNTQPVNQGV